MFCFNGNKNALWREKIQRKWKNKDQKGILTKPIPYKLSAISIYQMQNLSIFCCLQDTEFLTQNNSYLVRE